jgi:hypothetical protein
VSDRYLAPNFLAVFAKIFVFYLFLKQKYYQIIQNTIQNTHHNTKTVFTFMSYQNPFLNKKQTTPPFLWSDGASWLIDFNSPDHFLTFNF